MSILRQFTQWVVQRAKKGEEFQPDQLTAPVIERYLFELSSQGYSYAHCKRVKSVITHFCQWFVDEQRMLPQNPARGVKLAPSSATEPMPPRTLSPQQRSILQNLVKQDDLRGQALFALGYWAGCRVTDITHLLLEHTHVGAKSGWLHLGEPSGKVRDIDLANEARRPLHAYLQKRARDEPSPYVFPSQRSARLTEAGLHHWFRSLKQQAPPDKQTLIADISFQDLRDDFVHRAISAGWTLEEAAYYLGHITLRGTPAVQTTIRYTQMTRAQVKEKLKVLKG
ncbi:MAG TPA: tyrosine-type recombinase/integrase [Ktedonobacteraceae bacterium]|nr:tyrosine-type recombinase/integrase [Ktedonobacteraceae bacterium]